MSPLAYLATALGIFFGFHLVHYTAHRLLTHRDVIRAFYESHHLGHHVVYTHTKYVSPHFRGIQSTLLADWFFGSLVLGAAYLALPEQLFLMVVIEGIALAAAIAVIHRAFHIDGHFLKRLPILAEYDRLHVEHHRNVRTNYGILFHGFDRLFGSFAPGDLKVGAPGRERAPSQPEVAV